MKNDTCIFCKIVSGSIPSYKIHENDDYLAILDIAQFTEAHTIVIPKKHFETIWDAPDIAGYYSFVQEIGDHFKRKGYAYVDTLTMGQMVHHAHVHMIPHNGDSSDWETALRVIGKYQLDAGRRLTQKEGNRILKEFAF